MVNRYDAYEKFNNIALEQINNFIKAFDENNKKTLKKIQK